MEQEHRITYKAGITRTPSDFLCADGELAECINLATDNEELKPMVQPAEVIDTFTPIVPVLQGFHLLYVHKFNDEERYIGYTYDSGVGHNENYLCYATKTGNKELTYRELEAKYTNSTKVTSIGKTLVVTGEDGIQCFIWNYTTVGNDVIPSYLYDGMLPEPKFDFWFVNGIKAEKDADQMGRAGEVWKVYSTGNATGMIHHNSVSGVFQMMDRESYTDLMVGLYSRNKKSISANKNFCRPFFIRTALELYDGTYTHISQPILMFPCETENSYSLLQYWEIDGTCEITLYTTYSELHFTQTEDLSKWSDLVKDVVIFVSDGIELYNLLKDQPSDGLSQHGYTTQVDGVFRNKTGSSVASESEYLSVEWFQYAYLGDYIEKSIRSLAKKEKASLLNDIKSTSIFYKIASVGLKKHNTDTDMAQFIDERVLVNLTTQERIEDDDWYSRTRLSPEFIYAYNSRLNIASVKRGFFEGYGYFMPYDNNSENTYNIFVKIQTDDSDIWVRHTEQTKQRQGLYFFYPDSRAKWVTIYNGSTLVCNNALTEHPFLNGAYFFRGLPGIDYQGEVTTDSQTGAHANDTESDNDYFETLSNYIITSEVNNPWVFTAKGYNKVGTGKIIGMSTTTQALSQAQFGAFPLLVFSESGIWAMSVDSTGLYSDIQPIGRDVCINPSSILQTDGAVFFVSKKGLMVAERAGNGLGVRIGCVSAQMNGQTFNTSTLTPLATGTDWAAIVTACQTSRSFLDYIRDTACFMAYDYIDSRILIVNPNFGFAFAYNIADGTISKTILPAAMTNAVNNYPDYLLQGTVTVNGTPQTRLYSFYEKQREEEVSARILAFLLTRPMKLSGPVSQSSLRQLKNVGTWLNKDAQGNELSCVKTEVYLSEDIQKWYSDISRHGAAARYYRLALYIKMLPTERLSGTILTEQERRSNNIR